ncbi:nucleoside deaminase [Nocardioides glacieisoli]|nr:nucleoside deaminase [Nocardioides glacieisoli]
MTPEDAVALALDVAERGLADGEMPIGAVVLSGDRVLGEAFTQERTLGRRIVHADLLALQQADVKLGLRRAEEPLVLAVNLEPCMMCLGAAITLGVGQVYYALESPNDGGVDLLSKWLPPVEQPFFSRPGDIRSGFHRSRSQRLFGRYAEGNGPAGMRRWAAGLAAL